MTRLIGQEFLGSPTVPLGLNYLILSLASVSNHTESCGEKTRAPTIKTCGCHSPGKS